MSAHNNHPLLIKNLTTQHRFLSSNLNNGTTSNGFGTTSPNHRKPIKSLNSSQTLATTANSSSTNLTSSSNNPIGSFHYNFNSAISTNSANNEQNVGDMNSDETNGQNTISVLSMPNSMNASSNNNSSANVGCMSSSLNNNNNNNNSNSYSKNASSSQIYFPSMLKTHSTPTFNTTRKYFYDYQQSIRFDYMDAFVNGSNNIEFIARISQMQKLQMETIEWERKKKQSKKKSNKSSNNLSSLNNNNNNNSNNSASTLNINNMFNYPSNHGIE